MSQNFIVAFGGTGARCLEAIAYLAASRAIAEPLHVLLVDPDESNGNVSTTLTQLRRDQAVQALVKRPSGASVLPFFSTPINSGLGPKSLTWSNPQPNQSFGTRLQFASHSESERGLLELLYDRSDLEMTFEKGYVGRAHIGSLDLLRTLKAQIAGVARDDSGAGGTGDALQSFFRAVREATQRPGGARLLVIGSVFGGTGASGLPAIPPLMRQVLLSGLQRELTMGCIQLAPYFSFPPGRPEDPDSALHPLATQAALHHYALADVGYDRLYLLGAPDRASSNEQNAPGGDSQRNRAHYVELAAALAAEHFFKQPPHGAGEVLASGTSEITWDKLPNSVATKLRANLVSFATFCLMHTAHMSEALEERRHIRSKWHDDLIAGGRRQLSGQESALKELDGFARRFLIWAAELQRGQDVKLFALSGTPADSLDKVMTGGGTPDAYHHIVEALSKVGTLDQDSGEGWYVQALTQATDAFCKRNYNWNS